MNPTGKTLDPFFFPTSVAIVGISRQKPSLGKLILENIHRSQYSGKVYLVNPNTEEINGMPCFPSLQSIDQPIDLVIIITPQSIVTQIIQEALFLDISASIIITAGFGEVSDQGKQQERIIEEMIAGTGHQVIGPNSMGVFSAGGIHASFSPVLVNEGSIAYLSQSGSIIVAILEYMQSQPMGISKFVSLGNKLDININSVLEYLMDDSTTEVVGGYLESFSDPSSFREIATKFSLLKPLVMVKAGTTAEGSRAATSHTGALAGQDHLIDAVLRSSGIIRCSTIKEQVLVLSFLHRYSDLQPGGIAIISSAGGPTIIATDKVINNHLQMAQFSTKTKKKLRESISSAGSVENPIDLIADATEEQYTKTIKTLLEDSSISAIILVIVHPVLIQTSSLLQELEQFSDEAKPIICCYLGPTFEHFRVDTSFPLVESTTEAIQMLAALSKYSRWKRNFDKITDFSHRISYESPPDMGFPELIEHYGFSLPASRSVNNLHQALEFSDQIGFPVVLKLDHKNFSHKSDVGGVKTDIRSDEEIRTRWKELMHIYQEFSISPQNRFVQIQKHIQSEVEFALGVIYDDMFGHFVMVGTGGKLIELVDDVRFHPLPVSRLAAQQLVNSLTLAPLFKGYRDLAPIDRAQLVELILNLDNLVNNIPSIRELDINPLLADPQSGELLVIDFRIELE